MQYSRPRQNLTKLEDQIKKFICGKFEEERITQVKKTTNWNINISTDLRRILAAEHESNQPSDTFKDFEVDIRDAFDPDRQRKRRGPRKAGMYGSNTGDPDFNPHRVPFKKYFVDLQYKDILRDFEDHMLAARHGGTSSLIRERTAAAYNVKNDQDEDIRGTVVQAFLKQIAAKYRKQCWAIPINTTLSDIDAIWEMVKNTRVHEIDNQDVEFSLSVMLKAYPCNIMSVWIYVAVFRQEGEDDDDDYDDDYGR